MNTIAHAIAFWASIGTFALGLSFVIFLEAYAVITKTTCTLETTGWRGIIPSFMFLGAILSAVTCSAATIIQNWI